MNASTDPVGAKDAPLHTGCSGGDQHGAPACSTAVHVILNESIQTCMCVCMYLSALKRIKQPRAQCNIKQCSNGVRCITNHPTNTHTQTHIHMDTQVQFSTERNRTPCCLVLLLCGMRPTVPGWSQQTQALGSGRAESMHPCITYV